jgi:hypothetical protein
MDLLMPYHYIIEVAVNNISFIKRVKEKITPEIALLNTAERLQYFFAMARENISLAKILEAHWDAVSILFEANKKINPHLLYGVWASEIPNKTLQLEKKGDKYILNGSKMFCSGAGLIDRALITATYLNPILIEVDLRKNANQIEICHDTWITTAFKETNTSTVTFKNVLIEQSDIVGDNNWYVTRKGFWAGAMGPAACWGGGAAGLLDYALTTQRNDPHTLAHLAAMKANVWGIKACLEAAAAEIDQHTFHLQELALQARHLIEQLSTDILRRFARAFGPFPLACIAHINQRYQELDLFLRQNHGERDLENLGKLIKEAEPMTS